MVKLELTPHEAKVVLEELGYRRKKYSDPLDNPFSYSFRLSRRDALLELEEKVRDAIAQNSPSPPQT